MSKKLASFSNRNSLVRNMLLLVLLATLLLSSCVNSKEASTAAETPTTTKTKPTLAPTKTPEKTQKAEKTLETDITPTITPTSIDEMGYYFNFRIITQDAANITTHEPPNNKYLYKYANVSFLIPFREATAIRMNLDNLEDNSFKDSDIVIYKTTGSGGTFVDLYPINGATYYFSDLHGMSYDSCMEHFPFSNMDPDIYVDQSWKVGSKRDCCIITNDGRLSIFRYVQVTNIPKDWGHDYLELVVTTYNQIIPEVLTPQPTNTPGPSPTPGRYSGMNLTMKQEANLDIAAQTFLDAVTAYDKEKVADLIEYPLAIAYDDYKYADEIKK